MIKSMTGFASLTREHEAATVTATIKSVNHRFLDVQLRIPPSIASLETRIRGLVQESARSSSSTSRAGGSRSSSACSSAAPRPWTWT
jgi:hypothetical protein